MPYKYRLSHRKEKTVWVTNFSSNAFRVTSPFIFIILIKKYLKL